MKYTDGWLYRLEEDEVFDDTQIHPAKLIQTDYIKLTKAGVLTVKKGYAFDGPSGPAWDSRCAMRGSLGHDALYGLLRQSLLPPSARDAADSAFSRWLTKDGMPNWRRWYWLRGVRNFAGAAADPANRKPVLIAP